MGHDGPPPPEDPAVAAVRLGALDFDFPPVCAVTLGTRNVYACLVCGVFLAGRYGSFTCFWRIGPWRWWVE